MSAAAAKYLVSAPPPLYLLKAFYKNSRFDRVFLSEGFTNFRFILECNHTDLVASGLYFQLQIHCPVITPISL